MQTAAIPYRVADFLKQHPPFQFMDEVDLVGLAARGRVRFHDIGEYICWQSATYTPLFFVIQQGSVAFWDESTDPATLRDILGSGDCIGIERFNGATVSPHSARTTSEVVLYAFQAADFAPLIEKYPEAAQYVAAHATVTAGYAAPGEALHPHQTFVADVVRDRAPLHCPPSASIQEAATLLSQSGAQALALTEGSELTALITAADILAWVAAGAPDPAQPVRNLANPAAPPVTVSPGALVSDCVLAMAESGSSVVVLTSDGTARSALQATVTAASLAPAFGDHPVAILREIATAPSLEALRNLNLRCRAWLLRSLTDPAALEWLAAWADGVNRAILARLVQLIGNNEPTPQLFCFYGAAGRQELLTALAPRIAVIGDAPASLESALAEAGFLSPEAPVAATLDGWKERFSGWIGRPIQTRVYASRPLFDLRPVHGPANLFAELEAHVRAELTATPRFQHLLANDCLSSLPPLTFFRDLVVEGTGEETDVFRVESSALQPLADVARVLCLGAGSPLGASTAQRFHRARLLLPDQEAIFREAAESMRLVLFHQARAGLRMNTGGAEIPLALLSRHDRQMLKSGFRSIHSLLEFTAPCEWLEGL